MFVVHALILTFMTTPLVQLFYPAKYRVHQQGVKKNAGDETATPMMPKKLDRRMETL